jgi:serine/threonine protein kinase
LNFTLFQQTDFLLGEGAFSTVFKARRISDGKEYALKKVITQKRQI